jgi:hypothetical protein
MGSGKSSVLEYVTSVDADAIAPIWIAVNHESEKSSGIRPSSRGI